MPNNQDKMQKSTKTKTNEEINEYNKPSLDSSR